MGQLRYPAGGWLAPDTVINWQREDHGKDLVIPWQGVLQAPASGHCVENGSDAAFPNGFGPRFAIVWINDGPFGGHAYYIGHCTSLLSPGEQFSFGHPVARADQGHNFEGTNGGWVELGQFQNGRCGPSERWFYNALVTDLVIKVPDKPLKFGDQGLRVLQMTGWLRDCGWLSRRWWHFNRPVHGAVQAFLRYHKLEPNGQIGGHSAVVLRRSAHWCRARHRHETK